MRHRNTFIIIIPLILLVLISAWIFSVQPSNNRNWSPDQKVLPGIDVNGDIVQIHNIRNISYKTADDYTVNLYDKTFNLKNLKKVWYMVERLNDSLGGPAHTLLSFQFENSNYVCISVELRKEVGEQFSVLKGLFRQYELMYVIADENDIIKLRTNYRNHNVYLYPIQTSPELIRTLFVDMLLRAQKLQQEPEFYHSLLNTCTTNIVAHVRKIAPRSIPKSLKILLPGYSDQLAYDLGLIDQNEPFNETKAKHFISLRAREVKPGEDFSQVIRESLKY